RKHLARDFSRVYHLDLRGDVKIDQDLAGTIYNVFGIQVGVGITIAIRKKTHRGFRLFYYSVPKRSRKQDKLDWLAKNEKLSAIDWERLKPDTTNTWLVPENGGEFAAFLPIGSKE